jgi:cation:H+ antiporter
VRIAEILRMPRIVIGSTLVSLATTTPELVVSILSGARGVSGLALGNAVGSCICNIGLILGLSAAFRQIDVHLKVLRLPLLMMGGTAVLLVILTLDLQISRWQGWLLAALGVGYFFYDFSSHRRPAAPAMISEARAIQEHETEPVRWVHTKRGTIAVFALGAGLVVVGSRLLVDGAVAVAVAMGIPSLVIGLTVIAIGTSLPELVTAISSVRQRVSDLSVGNILGANIANLTLIVGTAASLSEVRVSRENLILNLGALLGLMVLLVWFIRSDRRITRREGLAMVVYYGVYVAVLVVMTMVRR